MDFSLSEQQRRVQTALNEFLTKECPPESVRNWDETEQFPRHLIRKLGKLGYLGILVPESLGGIGGGVVDLSLVIIQLASIMRALSAAYVLSSIFGAFTVASYGSDYQIERFLPDILTGEAMVSMAVTEPEAGSDASSLKTSAIEGEDGFVINGNKIFISGVQLADYIIVAARTEFTKKPTHGISLFIVDKASNGITISRIPKLGVRALDLNAIYFDNVLVPRNHILGEINEGWRILTSVFQLERIALAAEAVGLTEAILSESVAYSKQRVQFGQPISHFDAIQSILVTIQTELDAARLLTYYSAHLADIKDDFTRYASEAKVFAAETCVRAANYGMRVFGGYGYTTQFPIERHFRDAKLFEIGAGTSEIQRLIIARKMNL